MKLKFYLGIGFVGGNHEEIVEIPDEEFEGKSEEETKEICEETFNEWMWDKIDSSWEIVG